MTKTNESNPKDVGKKAITWPSQPDIHIKHSILRKTYFLDSEIYFGVLLEHERRHGKSIKFLHNGNTLVNVLQQNTYKL